MEHGGLHSGITILGGLFQGLGSFLGFPFLGELPRKKVIVAFALLPITLVDQ